MVVVVAAQGIRNQLTHKKQSGIGVIGTANYTKVRFNTHSLDTEKNIAESEEIRADREVQDQRHSNRWGRGDILVEPIHGDHDWLWEAMMFSTFSANIIKIGVAPQYETIEDQQLDKAKYRNLIDALCSRVAITFRPGTDAIVKATASFLGTDMSDWSDSSVSGTVVEPSNKSPFATFNGGVWAEENFSGTELAVVTSLDLNIDNTVAVEHALGQQTAVTLTYGKGRVTGQMTMLFDTVTEYNKFINETETALAISLVDPAGNSLGFSMGRVKYNAANAPVAGERSRLLTIPFVALRDTSQATALQITRSA